MDFWAVAAAAGAGYLVKYWQKVFHSTAGLSGFPSSNSVSQSPLFQSFILRKNDTISSTGDVPCRKADYHYLYEYGNEIHPGNTSAEKSYGDNPSPMEVTSTITLYHGKRVEKYKDGGGYKKHTESKSGYRLGSDLTDIPKPHLWGTGTWHTSRKSRNSSRRKHLALQFNKPRSSLDSCLVAQMHIEREEMEDYVLSPLPSPCTPTLRPFLVADGTRLIGRASGDFRDRLYHESWPKAIDVNRVPYLPRIVATGCLRRKVNLSKNQANKTSDKSALMLFDSGGFSSGHFLFCLGISIGIMHTIVAQKLEVEKLKEYLKQSENLVQDLQEELEMKDLLTMKQLVIDDSSQDSYVTSSVNKERSMFSSQLDKGVLMKCPNEASISLKEGESMRTIEAELEAELERLELSMNGTTFQKRLSEAIELKHDSDEDIVAELVHGELRTDIVRRKSTSKPTPNRDSSCSSTLFSAKYGVSPHELTLRLHEVIESCLQNRIMELEAELAKSQMSVQQLESERINSWKEIWKSESSSNPSTPIVVEDRSPVTHPLVMNLSGDALNAYNEACEELSKIKETQKEDHKDNKLATHQVLMGKKDFYRTSLEISGEEPMPNERAWVPFDEASLNLNEGSPYQTEGNDDEDDDLLLTKQIVEKARQGSPAILRARRALISMGRE